MSLKQFLLLLIPSALWGSSFIFMKELAPIFGPVLTATLRIIAASLFLIILFLVQGYKVHWKRDWKLFMIIGLGNSAIPFSLYAYAALFIPSSLSVILNSTSPMFGVLFGLIMLGSRISWNKLVGVLLGTVGVGFVSSIAFSENSIEVYLSVLACIGAALLYGWSGAYVKKYAQHIEAKQLTVGSLTFAGGFLIIVSIVMMILNVNGEVITDNLFRNLGLVVLFGILCTSIPYIVYYKLLQEVGPTKALMVTYLMPIFGLIWSMLYGESIVLTTILGLIIILGGIYLLSMEKEKN